MCVKECNLAFLTETKILLLCIQAGESFRKIVSWRSVFTEREGVKRGEEKKKRQKEGRGGKKRMRYSKEKQEGTEADRNRRNKYRTENGRKDIKDDGVTVIRRKAPSFFLISTPLFVNPFLRPGIRFVFLSYSILHVSPLPFVSLYSVTALHPLYTHTNTGTHHFLCRSLFAWLSQMFGCSSKCVKLLCIKSISVKMHIHTCMHKHHKNHTLHIDRKTGKQEPENRIPITTLHNEFI